MHKTIYWVNRTKKSMEIKHYVIDNTSVWSLLGMILVPVVSIASAEMNTLVITRLSGEVMYLKIITDCTEGISICEEWV